MAHKNSRGDAVQDVTSNVVALRPAAADAVARRHRGMGSIEIVTKSGDTLEISDEFVDRLDETVRKLRLLEGIVRQMNGAMGFRPANAGLPTRDAPDDAVGGSRHAARSASDVAGCSTAQPDGLMEQAELLKCQLMEIREFIGLED